MRNSFAVRSRPAPLDYGEEMIIDNFLYFAPGIKFQDLDMAGDYLPDQFSKRIEGFYLEPAFHEADIGNAFASGLILVACIDGLAYFETGSTRIKSRFIKWCKKHLPSFAEEETTKLFYEGYRDGLVHNTMVKKAGAFSLEIDKTIYRDGDAVVVNPFRIAQEVRSALRDYVEELKSKPGELKVFIERLKDLFAYELNKEKVVYQ